MKAVIIGATGGIGEALAQCLEEGATLQLFRLGRSSEPPLDLLDEDSIRRAAEAIGEGLDLVIDATGFLHDERFQPEKRLDQLDPAHLAYSFAINATGPALLMKHFLPRLHKDRRAVFATLSARVGSISDNRLGGWYSYRAAKAALNQLMRTASIELARTHKQVICVSLHPGTVDTELSAPFARKGLEIQPPLLAAERLLSVIRQLQPDDSGGFFDHLGKPVEF